MAWQPRNIANIAVFPAVRGIAATKHCKFWCARVTVWYLSASLLPLESENLKILNLKCLNCLNENFERDPEARGVDSKKGLGFRVYGELWAPPPLDDPNPKKFPDLKP